ncbi:hypothetical protein LBMAG42_25780 [Deltaproteobacteria bacterium]|nr:hypothetical protein LBMAG42_25780 [Deltaproteobacteria bacterium]
MTPTRAARPGRDAKLATSAASPLGRAHDNGPLRRIGSAFRAAGAEAPPRDTARATLPGRAARTALGTRVAAGGATVPDPEIGATGDWERLAAGGAGDRGAERRAGRAGSTLTDSASNAGLGVGSANAEAVRRGNTERAGAVPDTEAPAPRAAAQLAVGIACIAATRPSRSAGAATTRSAARRALEVPAGSEYPAAGRTTAGEPGELTEAATAAGPDDEGVASGEPARGGSISGTFRPRVAAAAAVPKVPWLRRCAAPRRGSAGL